MDKIMYSINNANGKVTLEYLIPSTLLRDEINLESAAQALVLAASDELTFAELE